MNPLLSIVVASKNQDQYIPTLISSLQKQTFQDFEVIVVDSSSNDISPKLFRSYEKAKVILEDMKADEASLHGFKFARGKYLMLATTSDYLYSIHWLELAVGTLEKDKNLSLVWSSGVGVNEDGQVINIWGADFVRFNPPNRFNYLAYWFTNYYLPELNFVVHKKVFQDCINITPPELEFINLDFLYSFFFSFARNGYLQMYVPGFAHAGRVHHNALAIENYDRNRRFSSAVTNAQIKFLLKLVTKKNTFSFKDSSGKVISSFDLADRIRLPFAILKFLTLNKIIHLLKRGQNLFLKIIYLHH